ncbi:MAG: bifunctional riboflavin kinase/FAD synthetase [Pseudomonadota bacterium]
MKVIKGYHDLEHLIKNPVVTLGNFDGVHLGHQEILSRVREKAREINGTSLVYTFYPHPLSLFTPGKALLTITTLDEKLKLIEGCGIDLVICEPFNLEFSRITAEEFVKDILHQRIGVKEIFVGEDYAFGSKRQGNIYYLMNMGKVLNFRVKIVNSIAIDNIIVKSSKIRGFIQEGDIAVANRLLGRHFSFSGKVIKGKGRGANLGFPTANIKPYKSLHPGVGVYAAWVNLNDQRFPGAMNIGYNLTFKDRELSLEVHILDFNKDIYGQDLEIHFVARIRKEKAFSSPEELVSQMQKDISDVRNILGINHI